MGSIVPWEGIATHEVGVEVPNELLQGGETAVKGLGGFCRSSAPQDFRRGNEPMQVGQGCNRREPDSKDESLRGAEKLGDDVLQEMHVIRRRLRLRDRGKSSGGADRHAICLGEAAHDPLAFHLLPGQRIARLCCGEAFLPGRAHLLFCLLTRRRHQVLQHSLALPVRRTPVQCPTSPPYLAPGQDDYEFLWIVYLFGQQSACNNGTNSNGEAPLRQPTGTRSCNPPESPSVTSPPRQTRHRPRRQLSSRQSSYSPASGYLSLG